MITSGLGLFSDGSIFMTDSVYSPVIDYTEFLLIYNSALVECKFLEMHPFLTDYPFWHIIIQSSVTFAFVYP